MPRGIPNAKRDEVAMRFTLFNIPPQMNQKQGGSSYLKSEEQTLWGRNKVQRKPDPPTEGRRGSNVIVIHPGSRFLRIGRASDVFPVAIPNVIARKSKVAVPPPVHVSSVMKNTPPKEKEIIDVTENGDKMEVDQSVEGFWDPTDPKTSPIASSLRDRMLFYKLHIVPKASEICTNFNEQVQPEIIADHNDPYRVDWIEGNPKEDVLKMADPHKIGYTVRWPFHGGRFNFADYGNLGQQALLNDIETIWRMMLRDMLKIKPETFKDYSVILIIPDLFERSYVRELSQILMVQMGFKQLCVQQESISATYGAGISNACVIDAGATKTSIAIVDEGLVIPDTRITLNMGGNDITDFLLALLQRIDFPYKEADLSRLYDWKLMEELKSKICTLQEMDVAMNGYDFTVRSPGRSTERYTFRAYNEVILAPMCLFEPRVIEFPSKAIYTNSLWDRDVGEEIVEQANDQITNAMIISTQHLLPKAGPPAPAPPPPVTFPIIEPQIGDDYGRPLFSVAPQTATANGAGPQLESVDQAAVSSSQSGSTSFPGGFGIDVAFEAGKLPLDVAIFNSARAAGGDEKIRKYLQAVLVVGGTALIPGMAHALESRLQAIATPLVPNMEKVQIIPPPRDVDPRVLCWKGGAVLGKMEAVIDLWVSRADWDALGMRALKERSFFL
ncbi:hypothetical protein M422DRAFT_151102 [Sphaerobolus stellatus SS14]|nr:hypothetical protein M422DRAFT_151102 [Sphaerobolus stellatus SS14]